MKRLLHVTQEIAARKKRQTAALMTHVVLGYPSLAESIDIVKAMADGGASIIELQIPFSDPMADGPTIMRANEVALANGTRPKDCMKAMETLSAAVPVPLLFMSYFNLLFAYQNGGLESFCKDASAAGAEGLIVPDVPPEENSEGYWELPKKHDLLPIPLVSPLSSDERLAKIASVADEGFVYCVSTTGTTGARNELPKGLPKYLKNVEKHFSIPLALGFGISNEAQVKTLSRHADIAIVGSAMINLISDTPKKKRASEVRKFTERLCGS